MCDSYKRPVEGVTKFEVFIGLGSIAVFFECFVVNGPIEQRAIDGEREV